MTRSTRVKLPPVRKGYARAFKRCKQKGCGRVSYYDYVPFSLSRPIMTTVCGHGATMCDYDLEDVTEAEWHRLRIKELKMLAKKDLQERLE